MRAGRKPKTNVIRDSSGKSRGEPQGVSAEVKAVRERMLSAAGIDTGEALNALAGYTLGKLLLRGRSRPKDPGSISQEQYDAGSEWLKIVCRYSAINGFKSGIHSPSFAMVGGGRSTAEPDDEQIHRIVQRWTLCHKALREACREHGLRVHEVTRGVVVDNWDLAWLDAKDYGDLRTGLNALAKVLR